MLVEVHVMVPGLCAAFGFLSCVMLQKFAKWFNGET